MNISNTLAYLGGIVVGAALVSIGMPPIDVVFGSVATCALLFAARSLKGR